MDQVESSGSEFRTPRGALDVKRKSKKRRKSQPDDGLFGKASMRSSIKRYFGLILGSDSLKQTICEWVMMSLFLVSFVVDVVDDDDVCAICDDGGYVTCCDGGCLRSFHLTEEHGEGSKCPSLGINSEEAKMIIDKKDFICKNCKYKQHQCSACGLLGSSDLSSGAEVFQCKNYNCGHFYHPKCVSKLLHPGDKLRACHFEQYVAAGLKFLCHVHKCSVCHGAENRDDKNMQFAVCRLCPTTYHRKCLPSDIPFEAKEGPNGYIFQRAWDDILRDRILIYCMKHEIVKELGIPRRKLIIFPYAENLCVPNGPESAPKEQDTLAEEELLDHPSSEPSQSLPSAAAQNQCFCSNPMDSFAPKSLFPHPYPGSCGWLGD